MCDMLAIFVHYDQAGKPRSIHLTMVPSGEESMIQEEFDLTTPGAAEALRDALTAHLEFAGVPVTIL